MNCYEEIYEDVNDRIKVWGESDPEIPLVEFLDWTDEEYRLFVEEHTLPEKEINKHKLP